MKPKIREQNRTNHAFRTFLRQKYYSIMKKAIIYASSTGTTAKVASLIAKATGVADADIFKVKDFAPSKFADYDMLIVGSPTYGAGLVHDDWYDLLDSLEAMNLHGKTVAVFGCGSQTMKNTFCNAVGKLYEAFKNTGATMVGGYNTFPYQFNKSEAVPVEGAGAVGLLVDDKAYPQSTAERVEGWSKTI